MKKLEVSIIGATGLVGQAFISMLVDHPVFTIKNLIASDKNHGVLYKDSAKWLMPSEMPTRIGNIKLSKFNLDELLKSGSKIIFSALPSDIAAQIEPELIENGFYIFSNAGAMRRNKNVPILIPEANEDSIELIKNQGFPEKGFVITNANCSTTGLAVALAPLKQFGIKSVNVSTYQSVSGAGYPGISSMEIDGNLIPYIKDEEDKIIIELQKILDIDVPVYPTCVRVPVQYGHLESVWVSLGKDITEDDIKKAWNSSGDNVTRTYSTPDKPIVFCEENDKPNPSMSFYGNPKGMTVYTGHLRKVNGQFGFNLLVNNIIKGAAGGSVQNAELFLEKYGDLI